jgi:uncharacterized RDD family membrane protein YckC
VGVASGSTGERHSLLILLFLRKRYDGMGNLHGFLSMRALNALKSIFAITFTVVWTAMVVMEGNPGNSCMSRKWHWLHEAILFGYPIWLYSLTFYYYMLKPTTFEALKRLADKSSP